MSATISITINATITAYSHTNSTSHNSTSHTVGIIFLHTGLGTPNCDGPIVNLKNSQSTISATISTTITAYSKTNCTNYITTSHIDVIIFLTLGWAQAIVVVLILELW